ncbi:MAG TPA: carboxymuconolactone decarboxylase family protein [Nitrososphaerales archaeon]|nr:carboxymuconolactone decarboxylase family protein [Nitrososphaerales archaeon]
MTVESIEKRYESTRTEELVSEGPRLEPIENPKGLTLRFIYWMTRRRFGKVPTSLKVVVARSPKMMGLAGAMAKYEAKGVHLDKELDYMINILVAGTNGCGACLDIGRMMAVKEKMDMEKISAIPAYRTSSLFSNKERAALAYAEEATLHKRVSDTTFHELQNHFGDRDIVEITILTAIQNFANLTNIPLGIESDGLCAIAQSRKK